MQTFFRRVILGAVAALLLMGASGGDDLPAIVERWTPEEPTARVFHKVAVVGIVADPKIRRRFENKLVSHLRGRGLMAVASYTVVEDLAAPGDPRQILDRVLEQGIDGVISVRAFPLAKHDDASWAESWRGPWDTAPALRDFVADSLVLTARKADRYGLDFAVWRGSPFTCVWAGRTPVYPASRLRNSGGEILQSVITTFEDERLF